MSTRADSRKIYVKDIEMDVKKETVQYAHTNDEQYFRLSYSETFAAAPVVVIIHGGFWKQQYNIYNALIHTLAPFFVSEGYVACEVEYRRGRLDGGAGGWPLTNLDINDALIKLHEYSLTHPIIDINRVAVLGHSAGGHLCLWACSHTGAGGFSPLPFTPKLCVAVSPVGDLAAGETFGLSDDKKAVSNFMGCLPLPPNEDGSPNTNCPYTVASPSNLLPIKCKLLLISGSLDDVVPPQLVQGFYEKCINQWESSDKSNPEPELLPIEGADHFHLVNSTSFCWNSIYERIKELL